MISGGTRAALAWQLDRRLARLSLPKPTRRLKVIGAGGVAVGVVLAAIALHSVVTHEYQRFVRPGAAGNAADLRTRLTDPSSDGRLAYWRVAWRQFQTAPVLGHGAGTFETSWTQNRPTAIDALDAHSLYLETLGELGIIGLLLLLAFIVAVLVRAASRLSTRDRLPYATACALVTVWALHAGIDWDWEMPAVTLPIFAICGFVLARPADARLEPVSPARLRTTHSLPPRALAGIGCMSLALLPAITWLSQTRLDQATAAFASGNCEAAERSATASIAILHIRPEAYELLSYCAARRGMPGSAIAAVHKAISLDPNNWNFRYDLAVMRACAGVNPMPDARRAASLNPLEPLVQDALRTFGHDNHMQWKRDGEKIASAFTTL
jgi:hypothetical protein